MFKNNSDYYLKYTGENLGIGELYYIKLSFFWIYINLIFNYVEKTSQRRKH